MEMDDIELRVQTFEDAPDFLQKLALILAQNGFMYGGYGSHIRCVSCGMTIYTVYPGECPLSDHQDYAVTCYFNTYCSEDVKKT